jgi:hypothetical protein
MGEGPVVWFRARGGGDELAVSLSRGPCYGRSEAFRARRETGRHG